MQRIDLFPTTIWKQKIDPYSWNKNQFVETVYENYRRDPYRSAWTNDGTLHHCYSDWDNPKFLSYDLGRLMEIYGQIANQFVNSLPLNHRPRYNYVFVNVTANRQGQYMGEHDHTDSNEEMGCCYSCVHYVKLESHQPSTTFVNPLMVGQYEGTLEYLRRHLDSSLPENSTYFPKWEVPTEEDEFVIFPSYLKHKVRGDWKQKSPNELRITNVVNINLFRN
jgi:hypothetical protein